MQLRVCYGAELGAYGFPDGHPFGPDRLAAFWHEFQRRGLDRQVEIAAPVACTRAELTRFHPLTYVNLVERLSASGYGYLDQGDTPAFPGVYEAACTVVGSVLDAARAILERRCRRAFVPIAGMHHARRGGAAGFCVFNDIGVLIEWLRAEAGVRRVAYVDIDAHHGDGVYYGFVDDPEVVFADIHEDGNYLYPGTGAADDIGTGAAAGTKLNIPLPPGADDAAFHEAWPLVEEFVRRAQPQFIILQAGADSLAGDPLTHLRFSAGAHRHAAQRLCALADEYCDGRLLATGGGGYDRANLAAAWCAVAESMLAGARITS
jgi:acetoin utilization protein AcuC